MAYDKDLAFRVRKALARQADVEEKPMFGGLSFLVRRHMCCGVIGGDLVLRVGADGQAEALSQPHVRPMDFTGRPMKSMVYVAPGGTKTDASLKPWIKRGVAFTKTLPDK
jgi:TfoX/Sxy family transcriptional regulator of competence genes